MVGTKAAREWADENDCDGGARKRQCQRSCGDLTANSIWRGGCGGIDPAAEFLHQFANVQGPLQASGSPVSDLVW